MNNVVVITGAAGALGSAVVRHLVSLGYRAALVDFPDRTPGLHELAASVGGEAVAVLQADVSETGAWKTALAKLEGRFGPPTHAVLIAGTWKGGRPLHDPSEDDILASMVSSNLETAHASLRALLPGMVARKSGSVVLVGSRAVERPWTSAGAAEYAASKAAVVALAQVAAEETLSAGVRVNAILPSTLDTPANRSAMPDADSSRWVSTDSAAEVIAFLLSPSARDVSGAAIPVYGRS